MPLYQYDPEKTELGELAPLLNLTFDERPMPYAQFFKNGTAVGYVVRSGVISLPDEIEIPADLFLKRL
ncbi:MAG: hypothetical protein PHP25_01845 [Candidatus Moranbacteria bacterium]|nr:hypothetical protein [Candidatus Moranbacteria bacterium]